MLVNVQTALALIREWYRQPTNQQACGAIGGVLSAYFAGAMSGKVAACSIFGACFLLIVKDNTVKIEPTVHDETMKTEGTTV